MWRDPRLRGLSDDHHQNLVLASKLLRAKTEEELHAAIYDLLEDFPKNVDPHFRVEEEVLLTALAAHGEEALIARTREDHAFLREGVARAAAGETAHLTEFAERLRDHVRFEEKELFERCQEILPEAVLEKVWDLRPKK